MTPEALEMSKKYAARVMELEKEVAALKQDIRDSMEDVEIEKRKVAALTKERDEKVLLNNQLADYLGDAEKQTRIAYMQSEAHKTGMYRASDQLAAAQATNERLRDALQAVKLKTDPKYGWPIIHEALALPNDTTALDARLKAAYKRGYEDGVHCNE